MKTDFTKKESIPDLLTLGRVVTIPLSILIPCLWENSIGHAVATTVLMLVSITGYLDDYLAREWQVVTNFGKFADPLTDKMLVMTAFIIPVKLETVLAWTAAIIICRESAVAGLRLLLVENSGTVLVAAMPRKIKTFAQMSSIIFLLCHSSITGTPLLYMTLIFTTYSGYGYFKGTGLLSKDAFR